MNVREIVGKFGGQSSLARALSLNQSAVAYWVKKDSIPGKWHSQLLKVATDKGIALEAADLIARPASFPPASAPATLPGGEIEVRDEGEPDLSPFLFYAAPNGSVKVQVLVEDETVWASQRGMADIFEVEPNTITYHLKNIFDSGELPEKAVTRNSRVTAVDNKSYDVRFYSLDVIISVGYRVNSYRATQFRVWATTVLREYLIKGFALNDDRLKQGKSLFGKDYFDELLERIREIRASERRFYQKITDIYAQCSIDYDAKAPVSQKFYAHVQDKLHFAITGHTAAELIGRRADASKPHMGLTHWKNEGSSGKITKNDVTVGKNYLTQEEIENLERLVSMYLDFADNLARRHKAMTMTDWAKRLDGFLEFNAYEVLGNFGTVKRDEADRHAIKQFEKFRIEQDKSYKSDFDKIVDDIKIKKKLPTHEH